MTHMRFEMVVQRDPEAVFHLLSDLHGYRSWLPSSSLFSETSAISDHPVVVGTTYVDRGPASEMRGEVTELEPFSHVAFHQQTFFRRFPLYGRLDIRIHYTLQPWEQHATRVIREIEVRIGGTLIAVQPILVWAIRREDERILKRIKWYLEAR